METPSKVKLEYYNFDYKEMKAEEGLTFITKLY